MKHLKLLLVVTVATTIGFFSAITYSQIESRPSDGGPKKEKKGENEYYKEQLLKDVMSLVKQDYVEEKSDQELAEAAAKGLLSSLDPHSSYMDEDDTKNLQVETKGEFGGVGIEITVENPIIKVVSPIEDTPAFRAGLKPGDYISKIDGTSVIGFSIEEVVKKLRGKPGTKVSLTILRKGEKNPLEKTLMREIIKVKAVRSDRFGNVMYVKINTFSEKALSGLKAEMTKLKTQIGEKNVNGLVLDLRNDPGGLLDQAVAVSDLFLDEGKIIVSFKGRDKNNEKVIKDGEKESMIPGVPIVVLVNEGSASASEIVAGALQDNHRAVIMGSRSFGKGSVQTVIPLSSGHGALRLTTSLYYTPSGKSIQAHGIEPDIKVSEAKIEKHDTARLMESESELRGHIKVAEGVVTQAQNEDLSLYEKDYQVARAVDLVRGVSLYKKAANETTSHIQIKNKDLEPRKSGLR